MTSIPRLSRTLKTLFESDAPTLAHDYGLRERVFSAKQLAYLLVLGWLGNPQAGLSALARFAGSLGLRVSKQVIDERLTMRTAIAAPSGSPRFLSFASRLVSRRR